MTDDIPTRLLNLHASLGSWSKVAEKYELSKAMVWRVANQGYEPKDPEIRKKLGFPEIITQIAYRNNKGRFASQSDK